MPLCRENCQCEQTTLRSCEDMLAVIAASAFALRDTGARVPLRNASSQPWAWWRDMSLCELQPYAYANIPLPIGFAKTISQPFVVALMTDRLDIKAHDSVLEIGTGLGYHAAILAQLARRVYSVEIIEEIGQRRNNDCDGRATAMLNSRLPMATTLVRACPLL
jgi:protein-L-isoaspartate(D-aspartate) O-methyltransferase